MFVRKKKNRSGSISVVIVDKSSGQLRYLKTIGVGRDEEEVRSLYHAGLLWVHEYGGQRDLFEEREKQQRERLEVERVLSNVDKVLINGTQLIIDRVFHQVGFDAIEDNVFKQLVIARICQPLSKAGTVDYLGSHFDEDVQLHSIYRYLDKLHNTQQELLQRISVEHTRKILGDQIGLVFYDVTTLYFESDSSDELRSTGFSKDGKHSQPQVVLGLLVSAGGYPLSYSLFNGSQYEGYTMLPIVEDFVRRFQLEDFVVVADSGLMNKKNIELLESGGYRYIIGARIKNESEEVKSWILSLEKKDGLFHEQKKNDTGRLIIGFSSTRAKKDAYNRQKGIQRLKKAYKSGMIKKENINRRGYNKFLELQDDVKISINEEKISEDTLWDGLKGYITNTTLSPALVYEQYRGLWVVENAFRITKGTLELRPVFHFTPKRIEAHVCICFAAYKVYKELERILKESGYDISVNKVLNIAKTVTTIRVNMPYNRQTFVKTMLISPKHKLIAPLFEDEFWIKWK